MQYWELSNTYASFKNAAPPGVWQNDYAPDIASKMFADWVAVDTPPDPCPKDGVIRTATIKDTPGFEETIPPTDPPPYNLWPAGVTVRKLCIKMIVLPGDGCPGTPISKQLVVIQNYFGATSTVVGNDPYCSTGQGGPGW